MRYYVGPWELRNVLPGMSAWCPPTGCGGLDLRILPKQSTLAGTPGLGVFYTEATVSSSDFTLIGSGSWNDIRLSTLQKNRIPKRTGFVPSGDTLRDVLVSILTEGADYEGLDGPKPIMPTMGNRVELLCGETVSTQFRYGQLPAYSDLIRSTLRKHFAELFENAIAGRTNDPQLHRRVLDYWCKKYGINKSNWREFVPVVLQPHIEGVLPHNTSISENFNGTDGTAIGNLLTWTDISGTWVKKFNAATKSANNNVVELTRADSDLSSSDHYAQITRLNTFGNFFPGPCARVPSTSTVTFYTHFVGGGFAYITKMVAGAQTNIVSTAIGNTSGDVYKIECNGSSIKAYLNGTQILSTTDTAITTGVRCGLVMYAANSTVDVIDDFSAADLASTADGAGSSSLTFATSSAGSSLADATCSSTLVFAVTATGATIADATCSSTLTFATASVGDSLADATGSSSLTFTASAVAESTLDAAGSSSLTFTVSSIGLTLVDATGSSSLTFGVLAVGASVFDAIGSSSLMFGATAGSESTAVATGSTSLTFVASAISGGNVFSRRNLTNRVGTRLAI